MRAHQRADASPALQEIERSISVAQKRLPWPAVIAMASWSGQFSAPQAAQGSGRGHAFAAVVSQPLAAILAPSTSAAGVGKLPLQVANELFSSRLSHESDAERLQAFAPVTASRTDFPY